MERDKQGVHRVEVFPFCAPGCDLFSLQHTDRHNASFREAAAAWRLTGKALCVCPVCDTDPLTAVTPVRSHKQHCDIPLTALTASDKYLQKYTSKTSDYK